MTRKIKSVDKLVRIVPPFGRRPLPSFPSTFAPGLIALAAFLASLRGGGFGRRASAFLHAGGEGAPAAGGCVLARDRLVGVIARRYCEREDDKQAQRAQAALRTSHHPALRTLTFLRCMSPPLRSRETALTVLQ